MPSRCVIPGELTQNANAQLLTGILRGVEREALRVDKNGRFALSQHPSSLGSALTHPRITTDFSEALMEFITPPSHRTEELFEQLSDLQRFTAKHLNNEVLWANSMPCAMLPDNHIPVAQYGSSNNGLMKTIYRIGLGHRYGRTMQTVSGLHYNFSLPNAFWAFLSRHENSSLDLQEFKNQKYFALIRNFRRYYWLLIYLFGASPAICRSFARGKTHNLKPLNDDEHTLHLPYATSLRMGDLGYQSSAQEALYVCYNDQEAYIQSLCRAIITEIPQYRDIGLTTESGDYKQLNTSLLQIENEFYSAIRPKRTAKPGETALTALKNRGVEYIEVRCLDINPFEPLGITSEQIHFLDTFLLFCALLDSPECDESENKTILNNQKLVVNKGREPGLCLQHPNGDVNHDVRNLKEWSLDIFQAMEPIADLLDKAHLSSEQQGSEQNHARKPNRYKTSLTKEREKIVDTSLTPSARLLNKLSGENLSFQAFTLTQSLTNHRELQTQDLEKHTYDKLVQMAEHSLEEQKKLEAASTIRFPEFLTSYYQQYTCCKEES